MQYADLLGCRESFSGALDFGFKLLIKWGITVMAVTMVFLSVVLYDH